MSDILEVRGICKSFSGVPALGDISFRVSEGEILCLLGPSGCGKTTLLRIVAGLETPDAGMVAYEGQDIGRLPPYERHFGLMFQDFALFPHKNVFDNVAFGLRMKEGGEQPGGEKTDASVREMLALVGLAGFENRNVSELSGGEAQRVALARSLAPQPRLLMLDEPLGSLDRATRERLMVELRDILRRVGVTALYVTHDQTEAFSVADRAMILNAGRIEQSAKPEVLYRRPASKFVAQFLGMSNLAAGKVVGPGLVDSVWGTMKADTTGHTVGAQVMVLVRPEAAQLVAQEGQGVDLDACVPDSHTVVRGRLVMHSFRSGRYRIQLQLAQGPALSFDLTTVEALAASDGDALTLALHPAGVVLLPADP